MWQHIHYSYENFISQFQINSVVWFYLPFKFKLILFYFYVEREKMCKFIILRRNKLFFISLSMAECHSFCVVLFHYAVICSVFLHLTSNRRVHTVDIQCLFYETSSGPEGSGFEQSPYSFGEFQEIFKCSHISLWCYRKLRKLSLVLNS